MKYLLLLRGINVGGNKKVSMDDLKKVVNSAKVRSVSTLLNTGNVIFESDENINVLEERFQLLLKKHYSFSIPMQLVSSEEIESFFFRNSIQKVVSQDDRSQKLIFTFAKDINIEELERLKKTDEFEIIDHSKSVLCIRFSSERMGTPEVMKALDRALNKRGTSRNKNTVEKIIKRFKEI